MSKEENLSISFTKFVVINSVTILKLKKSVLVIGKRIEFLNTSTGFYFTEK